MGQCSATTLAGEKCRARARPGRDFCFAHDPEVRSAVAKGRREGGRQRASQQASSEVPTPRPLRTAEDVLSLLEETVGLLLAGRVTERRATAVGFLGQVSLRALGIHFEERLTALEQAIDDFVGTAAQFDDAAVVIAKRLA